MWALYILQRIQKISRKRFRGFGSYGSEVTKIQTRLKNWGYYNGDIDGIYGSRTVNAVKLFQRKNGLTVDGIAGDETLAAIGISSTGSSARYGSV